MKSEQKVGFILPSGEWLGGRNYLRNLFAALQSLSVSRIVPVVLTGKRTGDLPVEFAQVQVVRTSLLDRKSLSWLVRKVIARLLSRDLLLQRVMLRDGISILSHSFDLGQQTSVKTIGWIPDFQHVHLPEFFSEWEIHHRNREYMAICQNCDKIIVSSACAQADLRTFAPAHAHKAALLRFVANPAPLERAMSLTSLQDLYQFNGGYFLLPNQFWAHKNHRLVLDALSLLKQRKRPLLVLATGSTSDHRNTTFFPCLMRYAAECDVLDCFRVLGQIPFDHLVCLMQHATAFINPSRFEGWSTSVEEAKSMGKQVVLSNLPVHLEQAPERGFFFPPNDPEALVSALLAADRQYDPDVDRALQLAARQRFPERQQAYGKTYLDIVSSTLDN